MEARIICNSCGAEYRVADEKLAKKRLRFTCRKCQQSIEISPASTGFAVTGGRLKSPFGAEMPEKFGNFKNLERLASGGMGDIFRATLAGAEGFERTVALKVLHPHLARDETFAKALVDEAKITVMMHHPNIVQMFNLERTGDLLYAVMEYVPGKSLSHIQRVFRKKGARIPLKMALYIVMQALEGLAYAHDLKGPDGKPLGIVHRDISPQNILVTRDGWVKIIDFGIAKAASRITETVPGIIKGKFAYMAPEQLKGITDHRADVFAMGVVLWETLAGVRLFHATTDVDTLHKVLTMEPPPISMTRREIPDKLDHILARAMDKDVEKRFQSARDFKRALAEFIAPLNVEDLRSELDVDAERIEAQAQKPAGEMEFTPAEQTPVVESASLKSVPSGEHRRSSLWKLMLPLTGFFLIGAATLWWGLLNHGIHHPEPVSMDAGWAELQDAGIATTGGDAAVLAINENPPDAGGVDAGAASDVPVVAAVQPAPPPRLTSPMVERLLYKRAAELQACADEHLLKDNLGESVQLKLRFTINAEGSVVAAGLEPANLEKSGFGSCMIKRIRAMRFPKHRDPAVTVVFPLTFKTVK